MKNIVFYIPAIIFIAFYGGLSIGLGFSVSPLLYIGLVLFIVSAVLLAKGIFAGGFLGALPGICLMYMSTQGTGQVINIELPLGMIVVFFYLACSSFVFKKRKE